MEKEIEDLKNEVMMHKRQKEMIAQLKIDLAQSKERILSLEQRLQMECSSKVANYVEQLEKLKKQYDEKVTKLHLLIKFAFLVLSNYQIIQSLSICSLIKTLGVILMRIK